MRFFGNDNDDIVRGCPDKPVDSMEGDLFSVAPYAKGLCTFIKTCETPMTISIQGDWGSGKTSIMNMIKENLRDDIYPIWFNTWQFSQFSLGNGLAFSMLEYLMKGLRKDTDKVATFFRAFASNLRRAAVVATDVVGSGRISAFVEQATMPDGDFDCALEILKLREHFQEAINNKLKETNRSRVVIFVDDLDRLRPGKAVEVLEILKLFLDCENCIFILAVDYNVVTMGIKEKFGESFDEEKAKSFFDKIIQLPFKMPVAQYDIFNYVKNMMIQMNIATDDKNVMIYENLIKTSIGFNPRGMKRLFNSYQLLDIIISGSVNNMNVPVRQRILFGIICMQMKYENLYNHLISLKLSSDVLHSFKNKDEISVYNEILKKSMNDEQKLEKIKEMQEFMQSFIDAMQMDDDDELSPEELNNLRIILHSSTVTALNHKRK